MRTVDFLVVGFLLLVLSIMAGFCIGQDWEKKKQIKLQSEPQTCYVELEIHADPNIVRLFNGRVKEYKH